MGWMDVVFTLVLRWAQGMWSLIRNQPHLVVTLEFTRGAFLQAHLRAVNRGSRDAELAGYGFWQHGRDLCERGSGGALPPFSHCARLRPDEETSVRQNFIQRENPVLGKRLSVIEFAGDPAMIFGYFELVGGKKFYSSEPNIRQGSAVSPPRP